MDKNVENINNSFAWLDNFKVFTSSVLSPRQNCPFLFINDVTQIIRFFHPPRTGPNPTKLHRFLKICAVADENLGPENLLR